ncbi:hypothetical protein [Candidatus Phytoplasma sp. AldY-WA1]|uniref:hypothetical protein n=1 Tax=Candidatus Phytoplasma sp. AldY-WA1 TaxID=2852100 RepID=UPI00254ADA02|nr:hypothetical protein [Candidatus Phytoplasma sp. AldY-WA1]
MSYSPRKNNNCRYISNKNTICCYSFVKKTYDDFDVYSKIINENNFYIIKTKLYQLFKTEKFQQFIQEYNQIKEFSTSTHYSKNEKNLVVMNSKLNK